MGCNCEKFAGKGTNECQNTKGAYAAVLEHCPEGLSLFVGAYGVRKVCKAVPVQGSGDAQFRENPDQGSKQQGNYVRTGGSLG